VRDGEARTDTLDRIWPPDDWAERVALPAESWTTAATVLTADADPTDDWGGGWRLNSPRTVRLTADGTQRSAVPGAVSVESVRVGDTVHLDLAGRSVAFTLAPPPDVDAAARAAAAHSVTGTSGPTDVVAPMPGAVLRVHAGAGQPVEVGDPVVTLEAMKMEHVVIATVAGRVGEVRVQPADQVVRGQLLAIIEP